MNRRDRQPRDRKAKLATLVRYRGERYQWPAMLQRGFSGDGYR